MDLIGSISSPQAKLELNSEPIYMIDEERRKLLINEVYGEPFKPQSYPKEVNDLMKIFDWTQDEYYSLDYVEI